MMPSSKRRRVPKLYASIVGLVLLAASGAQAYELTLQREVDQAYDYAGLPPAPADVVYAGAYSPGDLITFELYLDTEGQSDIILFSVGMTFDPTVIGYRPDLSDANDYYPLYAPGSGKAPATWLTPNQDPPTLWAGTPPTGLEQVNVEFVANNLDPTQATATHLLLATLVFEVSGDPGGATPIGFGLDFEGNTFLVDFESVAVDVWPQVDTQVVWAPEPSTALLVAIGLAGLGLGRRRSGV